MNVYVAMYLIIGAYFAGLNSDAGVIRIPLMMLSWPLILAFILWQDRKQRKACGQ